MSSAVRIRRLLSLIEQLQAGRVLNSRDLAQLCGVSRRTVFRDLKMLQDSGVPVLYDEQKQGYWMTSAAFLPPTDLTLPETLSLILLAHNLGGTARGVPFYQPARQAAAKLISNLPSQLQGFVGDLCDTVIINLPRHHPLTDAEATYQLVVRALTEKRSLRIEYHSLFDGNDLRTLLSPYRLLYARRTWYAIGRSSLHRAVRTFHLGRILHIELTDDTYTIPPRFSLERHLGNAWHLIRERGQREHVVIRFQPLVAANVAEVTWHKTQRVVHNDDGSIDFHVTVDGLKEISWWILGYGCQAEVLQPAALRTLIVEHVERLAAVYGRQRRGKQTPAKASRR